MKIGNLSRPDFSVPASQPKLPFSINDYFIIAYERHCRTDLNTYFIGQNQRQHVVMIGRVYPTLNIQKRTCSRVDKDRVLRSEDTFRFLPFSIATKPKGIFFLNTPFGDESGKIIFFLLRLYSPE